MARPPFLTSTRSRWRGDSWASTACTLKPMSNASTIRNPFLSAGETVAHALGVQRSNSCERFRLRTIRCISEMVVVHDVIRIHGMTIRRVVDLIARIGVQAQYARTPHPRLGKDF